MQADDPQPGNPLDGAAPGSKAIQAAASAVKDAAATEETRFGNLNVRAISLISAGSLVIALIAVFGKDLVTGDGTVPEKYALTFLLIAAASYLMVAIVILVVGVLIPGKRFTFGNNQVTSNFPVVEAPETVWEVQWREYRLILERLTKRNTGKAKALHGAYIFYGLAAIAAATAVLVALRADLQM